MEARMKTLGLVAALFAGFLFSACEEAQKPAEEPSAQKPTEQPMTDTVPAPEPSMGEPPSPNQPQPVYPEG